MVRLGTAYGGWWVSDDIKPDTLLISAGAGLDISFDMEMLGRKVSECWIVDPTKESVSYVCKIISLVNQLPSSAIELRGLVDLKAPTANILETIKNGRIKLLPFAISDSDGLFKFYPPEKKGFVSHSLFAGNGKASDSLIEVKTLGYNTVVSQVDTDRPFILKLDIEGSEYRVLKKLCRSEHMPSQLLVEFHWLGSIRGLLIFLDAHIRLIAKGYRLVRVELTNFTYKL